jgi:hypothetical protein
MRTRLARTADGWWLDTPGGLIRLGVEARSTGALLADRDTLAAAVEAARTAAAADPHLAVPAESLDLLSPVTAPLLLTGTPGGTALQAPPAGSRSSTATAAPWGGHAGRARSPYLATATVR